MNESNVVSERRWTDQEIATFYDNERVVRLRRRSTALCAFALLIFAIASPRWYWASLLVALIVAICLDHLFQAPLRARRRYETLLTEWTELLAASSPTARLSTTATLPDGEQLIYARPSERFAHFYMNGQNVTREVDRGELIVTNRRVLFLGHKQTLAISRSDVVRHTTSYSGQRITFEYPDRPAGEAFSVEPALFPLCMIRRGGATDFRAKPPAPLPLDIKTDQLRDAGSVEALA